MACCGQRRDANSAERSARWPGCVLCRAWKVLTRRGKTPYGDPCVVVPARLIRKPDPCIYSQFLLMQLGKPVTWDNPDVRILLNGVEQFTYNLVADTEYDVEITVHNSSRDKPALGTVVNAVWIEFGAGGQIRTPIASPVVDVPIWPGTAIAAVKWRSPATPGHYCIEVDLAHPDDGNPANNRGWNNTQVHAANSPVDRPIRIFNRHPGECPRVAEGGGPYFDYRRALFGWGAIAAMAAMLYAAAMRHGEGGAGRVAVTMALAYLVAAALGLVYYRIRNDRRRPPAGGRTHNPNRIDCHLVTMTIDSHLFEDKTGKDFDPDVAFANAAPPWPAHLDPPSFVFLPGEAFRDVNFHTDAPDDPGPAGHFNVNVWQGGEPSGGVTLIITRGP